MIFVVGMPRSGTTLTEQILSSHNEVHGAGELPYLSEFFNKELEEKGHVGTYLERTWNVPGTYNRVSVWPGGP